MVFEQRPDYVMIFSVPECNLFCNYCRKDEHKTESPLTNYEMIEMGEDCYKAGISRVRWTGGEPTVRPGFPDLVSGMSDLGIKKQYLSTNGVVLHRMARELKSRGLRRVNISLDTFDRKKYKEITGRDFLDEVLKSIRVATREFDLVKVNSVLVGEEMDEVLGFIDYVAQFPDKKPVVRFIPIGECGGAGSEDPKSMSKIKPSEIVDCFTERFGSIRPCPEVENNNPYSKYYLIEQSGIKFGLASADFARKDPNPEDFKTLRINPNGYVSNDLYSQEVILLRGLSRKKRVETLVRLIEEKRMRTKEWYLQAMKKPLKHSLDFWRFGK